MGTNNCSLIVGGGHEKRQSYCQTWARTTAVPLSEVGTNNSSLIVRGGHQQRQTVIIIINNSWDFSAAHYVYRSFIADRFLIWDLFNVQRSLSIKIWIKTITLWWHFSFLWKSSLSSMQYSQHKAVFKDKFWRTWYVKGDVRIENPLLSLGLLSNVHSLVWFKWVAA